MGVSSGAVVGKGRWVAKMGGGLRGRRVGPAAAYEEQPHVRDDEGRNNPPHEVTSSRSSS